MLISSIERGGKLAKIARRCPCVGRLILHASVLHFISKLGQHHFAVQLLLKFHCAMLCPEPQK